MTKSNETRKLVRKLLLQNATAMKLLADAVSETHGLPETAERLRLINTMLVHLEADLTKGTIDAEMD